MEAIKQHWFTGCGMVYVCIVAADGTFQSGPAKWDAIKQGTGVYKVTHNLGTLDYAPLATAIAGPDFRSNATIGEREPGYVVVRTFDSTQPADLSFGLLIVTL